MASINFPVKFAGETYDLNKFMKNHPGGVNTLERYRGRSIAQAMKMHGHSYNAYHMLNDLKVDSAKDGNLTGGVSENGRIITKAEVDLDADEIAFLEELESRLDWSKPIVSQLHKIAPHYQKWVNSAVYRECRLFSNPLLERMTFTPWYLVPLVWIPIAICVGLSQYFDHVLCEACTEHGMTNLQFLRHIVIGIVLWTLLEYSLHRWVFHYDPGSSRRLIQLQFLIHGVHHKVPFDEYRQVFPPIPAMVLAIILLVPAQYVISYPLIKMIGIILGYVTYDMIHYYIHQCSPNDGSYLYAMKRYHSNHHFINHDKAFGISSKLWDHVFKTIVQVKKLGFALRW